MTAFVIIVIVIIIIIIVVDMSWFLSTHFVSGYHVLKGKKVVKTLRLQQSWSSWARLMNQFPRKGWSRDSLDRLIQKMMLMVLLTGVLKIKAKMCAGPAFWDHTVYTLSLIHI